MPSHGGTTQRGYGHRHRQLRRKWQTRIDRGGVTCWRCGEPIPPNDPEAWDLGHNDHDRSIYEGPECRACNRRAGAKAANRKRWHTQPASSGADTEPRSREW